MAQKLGHWYTLVSDINQAEREAEKPPLFKKMFDGASVEEQALNAVIAKKKISAELRPELCRYHGHTVLKHTKK